MTFMPLTGLPQSREQPSLRDGFSTTITESIKVSGVIEIVNDFDIILFSSEKTLIHDGQTLPAGAVVVPALRKKDKKLAVFDLDETVDRSVLTNQVNYLGLSFASNRILVGHEINDLSAIFPFADKKRILMVCSDLVSEVSLGNQLGYATMLIDPDFNDNADNLGINAHYVASSV